MGKYRKVVKNLVFITFTALGTAYTVVQLSIVKDQSIERRQLRESIKKDCNEKGGVLLTEALGGDVCVRLEVIDG